MGDGYALSGLRYLPRQNSENGRVGAYSLYVSPDGVNWGLPVAQGTFTNTSTEKTSFFGQNQPPPPAPFGSSARYVRFVATSEVNGQPWTSMAEFNVLDANGNELNRTGWSISADSEEFQGEDGSARNVIDGSPTTLWHTDWSSAPGDDNDPSHPHQVIIDLGQEHELGGFRYLPRQASENGRVVGYAVSLSLDGVNWGLPVAQGTFDNSSAETTVFFDADDFEPPVPPPPALAGGNTRYVRLVAESEVNGQPWTSVAELHVLDANGNVVNRSDWTIGADSEELSAEDGAASNAIDGNTASIWHTDWATIDGDDNDPGHPHQILIDLGAEYELSGFRYVPRQNSAHGRIGVYAFYISPDSVNWGPAGCPGHLRR